MQRNSIPFAILLPCLLVCTGCSSLGLTLWPSQFPLLPKAKEFASQSPMPSGLNHELSKQVITDYYVEPGDRLLVEPVELDSEFESAGDQEVMVDGSFDLGRFGRIRVAGLTVESIEMAIGDRIEATIGKREPVNVQLIETHAARFYVLGAVGSPGVYDLNGSETVLDAILIAGGLTSTASPCNMILVRPTDNCECRVVQRVCYRQITQLGDVTSNYQLQPGDRIVVGERTLCEELAFWKQSTACPCCDRSRCVERNPKLVNYTNRFVGWLTPFSNPLAIDEENGDTPDATDAGNATDLAPPAPAKKIPVPQRDDSDIFLPPELPSEVPSEVE